MLRQPQNQFRYGIILWIFLFTAMSALSTKEAFAFRYPPPHNHGRVVSHLPHGYGSFRVGRKEYFHHRGVFYRHGPRVYVVIGAPIGAVIATLPIGFSTVIVAGTTYYYYDGVYYRHVPAGYTVVEPPPEVIVVQQPPPGTTASPKAGERVTVSAQRLNVRSGPGLNFSVIQVVSQGETLEVFGNAPGWLYVKLTSGRFGWVQQTYTTPVSVPPSG